jgi:hypothetical protein
MPTAYHAAVGRDQHVARLDVAVDLAGLVQGGEPEDELV